MSESTYQPADAKSQYILLLRQLGFDLGDKGGQRLRKHPRFSFDTPEKIILIQIEDLNCALRDVSVGGLSFFAPFNFNIGRQLDLHFDGKFDVAGTVVRVVLEKEISTAKEKFYMHGLQFLSEEDGYKCTVLVMHYLIEIMRQKNQ